MDDKKEEEEKSKRPLYILLVFLLIFGGFVWFISGESPLSEAMNEIHGCNNMDEVKSVYDSHKLEFLESDDKGHTEVSPEFQEAIRNKLKSLHLNETELKRCFKWLPTKTSVNIIVIPDLSMRIKDTVNNPNQIQNDCFVLNAIWNAFVNYSKFRQDTKDMLVVNVTDIDQAKGQFSTVDDHLHFDLSKHTGKSNRLYFTDSLTKQFKEAVTEMYKLGEEHPLGADYVLYFRRYLADNIKKTTLDDNYINKVIIITDGYLEVSPTDVYTKLWYQSLITVIMM